MIRRCVIFALLLPLTTALAADCQPKAGFELALAGQTEAPPCEGRDYRIDFELGRNLRLLRLEQAELSAALVDSASQDSRSQKLRLQVIERELHQLEGLARIRGLLPPQPDAQQD